MLFIINLLTNCIEYSKLINLPDLRIINPFNPSNSSHSSHSSLSNQYVSIYDYIHLDTWFPTNPYLIICFIFYGLYLICITINFINTIKKFYKIKKIYHKYLEINDYRLKFITWDEIVSIIIKRLKNYIYSTYNKYKNGSCSISNYTNK